MLLRIYGTQTSPYVRRVRALALELGLGHTLVDTASEEGQARLREVSPIWKIPVIELDGELVYDSVVIDELLVHRFGAGSLVAPGPDDVELRNRMTVLDGALDSLINCFYLGRDGVTPATAAYLQKHQDRAKSAMTWLDARIDEGWLTPSKQFGLAEIALVSALGWMRLRETYPIERHPALLAAFEQHDERPSLASTRPA
jgi:glutathione S-transferase